MQPPNPLQAGSCCIDRLRSPVKRTSYSPSTFADVSVSIRISLSSFISIALTRELPDMRDLPALFTLVREKIRTRHLALRTEQAYLQWVRRYVAFHHRRHPRELGAPDIEPVSYTHLTLPTIYSV